VGRRGSDRLQLLTAALGAPLAVPTGVPSGSVTEIVLLAEKATSSVRAVAPRLAGVATRESAEPSAVAATRPDATRFATTGRGWRAGIKTGVCPADMGHMNRFDGLERRSGADRRRSAQKLNGLAVLMGGCSECDRIAPSPAEMQAEGWEIISNDLGLVKITCPAHFSPEGDGAGVPDYLIFAEDHR
jgi:hypothetical protein